jgi:hypothetical protein
MNAAVQAKIRALEPLFENQSTISCPLESSARKGKPRAETWPDRSAADDRHSQSAHRGLPDPQRAASHLHYVRIDYCSYAARLSKVAFSCVPGRGDTGQCLI